MNKSYEFPAQWFNTEAEMIEAFGKEFADLRQKHVELGRQQYETWLAMTDIAAKKMLDEVKRAGGSIPAGYEPKLIRSTKTGGIALTLGEAKERKAKVAKVAAGNKLATFAKLYTKNATGELVAKPAPFGDVPASGKPNGKSAVQAR